MPWQQHVVDVALELDPDTGRFAYSEVGLLVPRQSGKSTLILSAATHRCSAGGFFGQRQRCVYTAQTRNKAREKFTEDFAPDLAASRYFAQRTQSHWGNGNEHIRYANGSKFAIEANTEKAGHGGTLDLSFIDEAFAQQDNRLEQAFGPAMITRTNTQLWWVSTAGWVDGSPYLLGKSRGGRDHAELAMRSDLAYFEWSAPEDADPSDEDVWRACMPALGHTITLDAIRSEYAKAVRDNDVAGFRRAYLNQWVPKDDPTMDLAVEPGDWAVLEGAGTKRPSPVAFAVAVSPDRKWSTIGVAGVTADDRRFVGSVATGRSTGWVVDRIQELVEEWSPVAVALDPSSPAGSLVPALKAAGIDVVSTAGRDVSAACGMFADGVSSRSICHGGEDLLAVSIGNATRRWTVGGAWQFTPADKSIDISPLWAAVIALFALEGARAQPKKKPRSGVVQGIR